MLSQVSIRYSLRGHRLIRGVMTVYTRCVALNLDVILSCPDLPDELDVQMNVPEHAKGSARLALALDRALKAHGCRLALMVSNLLYYCYRYSKIVVFNEP